MSLLRRSMGSPCGSESKRHPYSEDNCSNDLNDEDEATTMNVRAS